jgi:16S rRNA processing protein RimM
LSSEIRDIEIGKVLSPHGVGGALKVFPYSDFPERISLLSEVELQSGKERRRMILESSSVYGRFWLVKFEGVDSREEAARLTGAMVIIPLHERMPLAEGSYYHDQLVGLHVYKLSGEVIGAVIDIIATGGHDLLVIERTGAEEKKTMIPLVRKFVSRVDLSAGTITVDLPEGLLDL